MRLDAYGIGAIGLSTTHDPSQTGLLISHQVPSAGSPAGEGDVSCRFRRQAVFEKLFVIGKSFSLLPALRPLATNGPPMGHHLL